MREAYFLGDVQLAVFTGAHGGGGPFADAVYRQDCGLVEGRAKKCAGGMRQEVFREQYLAVVRAQFLLDQTLDQKLVQEPIFHRLPEKAGGFGERLHGSKNDALEFNERLFVKDDVVQICRGNAGAAQAKLDSFLRKVAIVLLTREAFFLSGGHKYAVPEQRCGSIMVETGNPENVH